MTELSQPAAPAGASLTQVTSPPRTLDDELAAALVAMNTAITSVSTALATFLDAAEVVTATVAAIRGVQTALPVEALPQPAPARSTSADVHTTGPWVAGKLYGVIPLAPLQPIPDNGGRWYAITRGTYVGLTNNSAVSLNAVTGVPTAITKKYTTQAAALNHFNAALAVHAVAILG
ncbi:hypothetical protein B0H11DRAFT_1898797 [Mycena galericulata]|nr:hypothetical protein B0H11DRAFT_1898797 [Mycena galericulata]